MSAHPYRPGFITTSFGIECARCERKETTGPVVFGIGTSMSASTFMYWRRQDGWRLRRLTAGDGSKSERPLWLCPDCVVTEKDRPAAALATTVPR